MSDKNARPPVEVGERRVFYSTLQGADGAGIHVRAFSGQEVEVVADKTNEIDYPDIGERMYLVRADNGVEFQAWEGELDGWYFETGQWFGPW